MQARVMRSKYEGKKIESDFNNST